MHQREILAQKPPDVCARNAYLSVGRVRCCVSERINGSQTRAGRWRPPARIHGQIVDLPSLQDGERAPVTQEACIKPRRPRVSNPRIPNPRLQITSGTDMRWRRTERSYASGMDSCGVAPRSSHADGEGWKMRGGSGAVNCTSGTAISRLEGETDSLTRRDRRPGCFRDDLHRGTASLVRRSANQHGGTASLVRCSANLHPGTFSLVRRSDNLHRGTFSLGRRSDSLHRGTSSLVSRSGNFHRGTATLVRCRDNLQGRTVSLSRGTDSLSRRTAVLHVRSDRSNDAIREGASGSPQRS